MSTTCILLHITLHFFHRRCLGHGDEGRRSIHFQRSLHMSPWVETASLQGFLPCTLQTTPARLSESRQRALPVSMAFTTANSTCLLSFPRNQLSALAGHLFPSPNPNCWLSAASTFAHLVDSWVTACQSDAQKSRYAQFGLTW